MDKYMKYIDSEFRLNKVETKRGEVTFGNFIIEGYLGYFYDGVIPHYPGKPDQPFEGADTKEISFDLIIPLDESGKEVFNKIKEVWTINSKWNNSITWVELDSKGYVIGGNKTSADEERKYAKVHKSVLDKVKADGFEGYDLLLVRPKQGESVKPEMNEKFYNKVKFFNDVDGHDDNGKEISLSSLGWGSIVAAEVNFSPYSRPSKGIAPKLGENTWVYEIVEVAKGSRRPTKKKKLQMKQEVKPKVETNDEIDYTDEDLNNL
jgi:hypothetical protein